MQKTRISAMLELRVLQVGAGIVRRRRDRHLNRNGRLKLEVNESFGGNDCLLAARSGVHARSGSSARQASDSGALPATCQRADNRAHRGAASGFGSGVLAPSRTFLAEGVGDQGNVFAVRT